MSLRWACVDRKVMLLSCHCNSRSFSVIHHNPKEILDDFELPTPGSQIARETEIFHPTQRAHDVKMTSSHVILTSCACWVSSNSEQIGPVLLVSSESLLCQGNRNSGITFLKLVNCRLQVQPKASLMSIGHSNSTYVRLQITIFFL